MTILRKILISSLMAFVTAELALAGILGHSGVVFHVDKYGHWTGHSSHYDYRFYPEKNIIDPIPLIDHHHNIIDEHSHFDDIHSDAYDLLDDGYHGSQPIYVFVQKRHHDYH
ncbi:hypothetical protein X975_17279, partial [Stegodyphus mimosarum]